MLRVVEQAFRTDTGRQRTANEDSYFASAPMFAVADGMGGAQAGEVASRIAAEAFEAAERRDQSPEGYLRAIVETANSSIHGLSQHDSTRTGMGTTLTAALVDGEDVAFAHVGDSRAYVFREGELRQLTSDHSLVEELRRQGRLTSEQAEDHPQRSIITRALGPEADVEIDTLSFSARPGDIFLLCSDGLTTMVKEDAIAEILRNSSSLSDAISNLVQGANEAGGRDNITVVAFRLAESDEAAIDPSPTLIGPSAEEAGLTSERVRGAADRAGSRRHEPRRSRVRTAAKVLAVSVVLAGIAVGAYLGMRQVYFLGIDEGGRVALYRGLPYDLPFDAELYSEVYSVPFQADSLPDDRRDEVTDHELRGRDDAVSLLEDLESAAVPATPSAPPAPAQPNQGNDASGNGQTGAGGNGQTGAGDQGVTGGNAPPAQNGN